MIKLHWGLTEDVELKAIGLVAWHTGCGLSCGLGLVLSLL